VVFVGQGKKFEIWSEQHWVQARETWLDLAKQENELPIELTTLAL
jgi:MraZ protein